MRDSVWKIFIRIRQKVVNEKFKENLSTFDRKLEGGLVREVDLHLTKILDKLCEGLVKNKTERVQRGKAWFDWECKEAKEKVKICLRQLRM